MPLAYNKHWNKGQCRAQQLPLWNERGLVVSLSCSAQTSVWKDHASAKSGWVWFLCLYSSKETESGTKHQQCRGAVCVKEGRLGSARGSLYTFLTSKGKNKLLSDGGTWGGTPGTPALGRWGLGDLEFSHSAILCYAVNWGEPGLYKTISQSTTETSQSSTGDVCIQQRCLRRDEMRGSEIIIN